MHVAIRHAYKYCQISIRDAVRPIIVIKLKSSFVYKQSYIKMYLSYWQHCCNRIDMFLATFLLINNNISKEKFTMEL